MRRIFCAGLVLLFGCSNPDPVAPPSMAVPVYEGGSCLEYAEALLKWEKKHEMNLPSDQPRPEETEVWKWHSDYWDKTWVRRRKPLDPSVSFPRYYNGHFTLTAGVWLEDGLRHRAMGISPRVPMAVKLSPKDQDCPPWMSTD